VGSLVMVDRGVVVSITHFGGPFRIISGVCPYTFYANTGAIKVAPVHITITSRCERIGIHA